MYNVDRYNDIRYVETGLFGGSSLVHEGIFCPVGRNLFDKPNPGPAPGTIWYIYKPDKDGKWKFFEQIVPKPEAE